mgnify:CR=1 FL=1
MTKHKAGRKPAAMTAAASASNPDLVDAVFEFLLREFPEVGRLNLDELKQMTRDQFAGDRAYVRRLQEPRQLQNLGQVLALFNGRNASEVARRLGIGRATVYRLLKQARSRGG